MDYRERRIKEAIHEAVMEGKEEALKKTKNPYAVVEHMEGVNDLVNKTYERIKHVLL